MAVLILLSLQKDPPGDIEHPSDDEIGVYELLVFLWTVEKRWALAVLVQDPAGSPETSEVCELVAKRLESWRHPKDPDDDHDEDSSQEEEKRKTRKKQKSGKRQNHLLKKTRTKIRITGGTSPENLEGPLT
jgi:hypothetical protein